MDDVVRFTLDGEELVKRLRREAQEVTELGTGSPVGKALVGMKEGDVKQVETLEGTMEVKVLSVIYRVRK